MEVNQQEFAHIAGKKNQLVILDIEKWRMVKLETNHGAKTVDNIEYMENLVTACDKFV